MRLCYSKFSFGRISTPDKKRPRKSWLTMFLNVVGINLDYNQFVPGPLSLTWTLLNVRLQESRFSKWVILYDVIEIYHNLFLIHLQLLIQIRRNKIKYFLAQKSWKRTKSRLEWMYAALWFLASLWWNRVLCSSLVPTLCLWLLLCPWSCAYSGHPVMSFRINFEPKKDLFQANIWS